MPNNSTSILSDESSLMNEMAGYLHADVLKIGLPNMPTIDSHYQARYSQYQLPLGKLNLVEVVVYSKDDMLPIDIEALGKTVLNAVNIWRKTHLLEAINSQLSSIDVLVLNIQNQLNTDDEHDIHNISCKKIMLNI